MTRQQEFGKKSEQLAVTYLRKQGHKIVTTNYHSKGGEIDIISEVAGNTLVFTEVRSKHDIKHGHPAETVDYRKQNKIRHTAETFLIKMPKYSEFVCRFDVITIVGEDKDAVLTCYEDAF